MSQPGTAIYGGTSSMRAHKFTLLKELIELAEAIPATKSSTFLTKNYRFVTFWFQSADSSVQIEIYMKGFGEGIDKARTCFVLVAAAFAEECIAS